MHKIIGSLTPATAGVPQTETLPESETPEVDAVRIDDLGRTIIWTGVAENKLLDLARSLERRLSLAQTEIKERMRVEDDLRVELEREKDDFFKAQARIAELEAEVERLNYAQRLFVK